MLRLCIPSLLFLYSRLPVPFGGALKRVAGAYLGPCDRFLNLYGCVQLGLY